MVTMNSLKSILGFSYNYKLHTFAVHSKHLSLISSKTKIRPLILSHSIFDPPSASPSPGAPSPTKGKPPLFVTHGLLGSKINWNSVSKAVARASNRQVVAFDARNHGDSPHTDEMDYQVMAEDIRHLADHLHVKKLSVLGHSMGGRAVMTFALKYPQYVDKLIVVDMSPTTMGSDFSEMERYLNSLINQKFSSEFTLSIARKVADKALETVAQNPSVRSFLLTNLTKDDKNGVHWKPHLPVLLRNLNKIAEFPPELLSSKYDGPALFIRGGKSPYVPDKELPKIKSMFPNATVVTMENSGHWPHADNPTEFISHLVSFLNENSAGKT